MRSSKVEIPESLEECQLMIHQLMKKLAEKDGRIEDLLHRMNQLLRDKFGSKAERFDPGQLLIFAQQALPEAQVEKVEPVKASDKSDSGHGRRKPERQLPRRKIEYEIPDCDLGCPDCGKTRTKFGEEISQQYDYVPASITVIEHVRFKYSCPKCQGHVVVAPAPNKPIDRGLATANMLAYIATSKFADHLPLNRLEGMFRREGANIVRSTMCDWISSTATILLPLYEQMKNRVLQSKVIWTDDTPVKVQDREHEKNIREGRVWAYLGDQKNPFTVYDFTKSRKRDGPQKFLGDFSGYLQADAFAGYDCIYASGSVLEVACMAHARRKFYDSQSSDRRAADEVLALISRLYDIERDARTADNEARKQARLKRAAPILHQIRVWLGRHRLTALPKSPLGKAITYALNNWRALCRYITDGELSIDNNVSERAMRPVALGRKNWLFAGSYEGGTNAAIIASFVQTCKQHGLNPRTYLKDVITRLTSGSEIDLDELLPGKWIPSL